MYHKQAWQQCAQRLTQVFPYHEEITLGDARCMHDRLEKKMIFINSMCR